MSVTAGITISNSSDVVNTAGAIENEGTMNMTGDITNNATISGNGVYNVAGDITNKSVFTAGTSIVY